MIALVGVAGREPGIAGPAVGGDRGGRRDVGVEKADQALAEASRTAASRSRPSRRWRLLPGAGLDRAGDHGLAGGAAAGPAGLRAADQGLVGLDPVGERLAVRPDHRAPDLVQPGPGGLVAAEAHLPLELHGRDPALARGDQIDREKPARQAGLGLLEDGAGEDRVLLAAGRALLDQPLLVAVGLAWPQPAQRKPSGQRARPDRPGTPHRCRTRQKDRQIPRQPSGTIAASMFLLRSLYRPHRIRQAS